MCIDRHRPPTELAQHSAYRLNSHRRNGAAGHIIDVLATSISLAYPSGEEGILLVQHPVIQMKHRNTVDVLGFRIL